MSILAFKNPKESPVSSEAVPIEKNANVAESVEKNETAETQGADAEKSAGQGESIQEAGIPGMTPAITQPIPVPVDPLTERIESILEEDLTDHYLSMNPADQARFKLKGEETLSKIRVLVSKTKVNAKKIFQLIREWLKIIPGVNRFFLEQEAKIKTDKILLTKEQR